MDYSVGPWLLKSKLTDCFQNKKTADFLILNDYLEFGRLRCSEGENSFAVVVLVIGYLVANAGLNLVCLYNQSTPPY
jgi:hypothetical protein